MSLQPFEWEDHHGSANNPMGRQIVEVDIAGKSFLRRADKVDWAKVQRYRYAGL